ncbi:hypothetical protein JW935_03690 [candidate division KSB1 bacterium]|nr:hypothetical protein [candidate division KSB1 bacterium]
MKFEHKNLAEGRWAKMSLAEQMANIGSEISRALNWKRKNNEQYCKKSVTRALELIYLTIDCVTVKSHLKELTRLREVIVDYFYGRNEYSSSEELWEKYFYHFNLVARRGSGYKALGYKIEE